MTESSIKANGQFVGAPNRAEFLAADDSGMITGQSLVTDAGRT